jgi:acetolactate synthase-1/2/3 large subunit
MYPLFDAFYEQSDKIRVIGARHEQGLAYMAFGYARSTGKLGVFSPVPGPGVLNTGAAMCTALGACAPVLCLTGEVPSAFKGQGRGHLHELPDQLALLKGLTKSAQHIEEPEQASLQLNEAVIQAMSGRRGPASLQICWDDLGRPVDVKPAGVATIPANSDVVATQIQAAKALLVNAKSPMIFVGTGAQHASKEISALAEMFDAPVVGFRGGRGIVGEDHDLGLSMAAAYPLWEETDLMIGIGSRMEIPFMRWSSMMELHRSVPGKALLRIDIDPVEMERLNADAGVVADSVDGVQAILDSFEGETVSPNRRREVIATAKATAHEDIRRIQPQMAFLDVIREAIPRDGFFVEELSQVGFTSYFGYPVYEPRTYVSCGYQGTLGYGFPTALGVKVGNPDKVVVSVTGDGGFMFAVQELATAVQYNIALVTLVFNNSAYGNVRRDQQTCFNNQIIGADLVNPDFVKLAESFGVRSYRADSPESLRPVLEQAIALEEPVVIEIVQERGSETSPWEFIHPAG